MALLAELAEEAGVDLRVVTLTRELASTARSRMQPNATAAAARTALVAVEAPFGHIAEQRRCLTRRVAAKDAVLDRCLLDVSRARGRMVVQKSCVMERERERQLDRETDLLNVHHLGSFREDRIACAGDGGRRGDYSQASALRGRRTGGIAAIIAEGLRASYA